MLQLPMQVPACLGAFNRPHMSDITVVDVQVMQQLWAQQLWMSRLCNKCGHYSYGRPDYATNVDVTVVRMTVVDGSCGCPG